MKKKTNVAHYETLTARILALAFVGLVALPHTIPNEGTARPALIVDVGTPHAAPSVDDAAIRRFPADASLAD